MRIVEEILDMFSPGAMRGDEWHSVHCLKAADAIAIIFA